MHMESYMMALRVWNRACEVKGYNPFVWRKDFAGAWIRRDCYNCRSKYGWTMEMIVPATHGGKFILENLEAFHWKNAWSKRNDYPIFSTVLTSDENVNIEKTRRWQISQK